MKFPFRIAQLHAVASRSLPLFVEFGVIAGIAAGVAACSNDSTPATAVSAAATSGGAAVTPPHARYTVSTATAASVSVSPTSASGSIGESGQFNATAKDANGNAIGGKTISWRSSDSTIVTVTSSGEATAIGVGPAVLYASADGVTGSAQVTGTGDPIATITPSPTSLNGTVGESAGISVTVRDPNGNTLTGRRIIWTSSAPSVATVDVNGVVRAIASGSATITATSGGHSATVSATVGGGTAGPVAVASIVLSPGSATGAVGQSAQFTATLKDAGGNVLTGRTITWASANSAVATVDANGYATAKAPGTTTLTATSGSASGAASVTVTGTGATPPASQPSIPTSGSAEPSYQPGSGVLIWHDSFDGVLTDVAALANYITMTGESGVHIAPGAGLNGSNALRTDWVPKGNCQDDSHLIERGFPAQQEVYVQYSVRYTPGFIFDWNYSGQHPCVGNAKKLFFLWSGSGSRFDFISENHTLGVGGDNDHPLFQETAGPVVTDAMLGDGNWHRITLHVRQSSTPTATDGFIYGWVDGVLRWSVPNWASQSSGGWNDFKMPTTFNEGSPVNQAEWLDELTIWHP